MLGRNHRVRNTPVSSRTTKDHSAISPSMNDQWSGNTLRRFFRMAVASPSRSSNHPATAPALCGFCAVAAFERLVSAILLVSTDMSATLPETRPDGLVEPVQGSQVAVAVHRQRELGQWAGGGTEQHLP